MGYLAEHQRMLKLAASNQLPRHIDQNSELSIKVCRELYEAGLLDAVNARTMDGDEMLEPRITVRGREYLNELEQRASAASPAGKAKRIGGLVAAWIAGVLTTVAAGLILRASG